ncbi:hypothetical protein CAEBREN_17867 [Caenorhabditis brenneri]|uniref:DUF7154 domain-containing protein n=1 Tax=Caenorhabditis brenneri TaxID=135651 RepID=G0N2M9_CAEBE|nr:hypothetical protein CAEBREN_17867 [Caenorhabditis brenneri]
MVKFFLQDYQNIHKVFFPADTSCDPTTPTTYLFAYSNDFDPELVISVWDYIKNIAFNSTHYSQVGTVWFDNYPPVNITFHTDEGNATAFVLANLPDPSLRAEPGAFVNSFILITIQIFLEQTEAPVCGARLFMLGKHYLSVSFPPIDDLVVRLRQHHVITTFMISTVPYGGFNIYPVYDLATRTNGFCAFNDDEDIPDEVGNVPAFYNPYLVYAANPTIPGSNGTAILPPFTVPSKGFYWLSMTSQKDVPRGNDCDPWTETTFLFAYSNDIDSGIVQSQWHSLAWPQISSHFSHFASIRFDTRTSDDFSFHGDWRFFFSLPFSSIPIPSRDVNASIMAHLPNPSLSFSTNTTGSDVFKMIDRFLDINQVPVCGSKLFMLVKRYPNETDISQLVSKMRKYHCTFTIQASTTPSGGYHPESLYELASKTNGFCVFDTDAEMKYSLGYIPSCFNPYLIYAANPYLSQSGQLVLPPMTVPEDKSYWSVMTFQDNGRLYVVNKVLLVGVGYNLQTLRLGVTGSSSWATRYGNHVGGWEYLEQGVYNMTLDYDYSESRGRRIQIRIFETQFRSDKLPQWAPYDN